MKDKIFSFLKDNIILCIMAAFYCVYMVCRMFLNGPWYDELYTYYYFISRGPAYAAIHWPVPNNHVGYSVISACLDIFKNPYIRLRGISVAASVANLILVYVLSHKFVRKELALIAAGIYASAGMVCSLGIQGRGYTLAVTCMLLATISMYHICVGHKEKRYLVGFVMGLTYGLYILPSSVYWVLPVCCTGGFFLLIKKEWKKLISLVLWALLAAVITFGLYALIWLAIGANLMSDDPTNAFYGVYQVNIILKAPFASMKTGIDYMLATPYIQSIERSAVITGLWEYLSRVYDQFFASMGNVLVILQITGIAFSGFVLIDTLRKDKDENKIFISSFILLLLLFVPIILIVQSVQPYLRVLGFMMVPFAVFVGYAIDTILHRIGNDKKVYIIAPRILLAAVLILGVCLLASKGHRMPLADRENDIHECVDEATAKQIESIYYTDDFQKYVLKFYYDADPFETSLEEAQFVMVSSEMKDADYNAYIWPMLVCYDEDMLEYIDMNFDKVSEGSKYTLLKRK